MAESATVRDVLRPVFGSGTETLEKLQAAARELLLMGVSGGGGGVWGGVLVLGGGGGGGARACASGCVVDLHFY